MEDIRYVPNYEKLRDEAVEKYKKERKEVLLSFVIMIFINLFVPGLLILTMADFSFLWKIFGIFFLLMWFPFMAKKWKEPKQNYLYRLHKAVDEMEKADVYMQIPEEDLHRFDGLFR